MGTGKRQAILGPTRGVIYVKRYRLHLTLLVNALNSYCSVYAQLASVFALPTSVPTKSHIYNVREYANTCHTERLCQRETTLVDRVLSSSSSVRDRVAYRGKTARRVRKNGTGLRTFAKFSSSYIIFAIFTC